jgi:hypothetical protein
MRAAPCATTTIACNAMIAILNRLNESAFLLTESIAVRPELKEDFTEKWALNLDIHRFYYGLTSEI